ncbi:hypothetical protein TBLA_0G00860 [Henningerozyma blattae CBS 6284]|uniref:C2H2-type domain-containing protein n=1 Tax=Henningerozyma blattae (strain ATCC 34711 / CBS 6284 / DSM 70876 / NBRC 10599 / NRRL Y-10934 / UCD 77-7) TaxID=1071380 RepID=I2H6N1_HENB6|nr:hypothetical protein TBLA_0G00860 [Tetrapisispora blattae CBS 6284]CCH62033.1 hypothetical protein TBLA_0G00860 [Tetrapisispora blattae CBS 6284]
MASTELPLKRTIDDVLEDELYHWNWNNLHSASDPIYYNKLTLPSNNTGNSSISSNNYTLSNDMINNNNNTDDLLDRNNSNEIQHIIEVPWNDDYYNHYTTTNTSNTNGFSYESGGIITDKVQHIFKQFSDPTLTTQSINSFIKRNESTCSLSHSRSTTNNTQYSSTSSNNNRSANNNNKLATQLLSSQTSQPISNSSSIDSTTASELGIDVKNIMKFNGSLERKISHKNAKNNNSNNDRKVLATLPTNITPTSISTSNEFTTNIKNLNLATISNNERHSSSMLNLPKKSLVADYSLSSSTLSPTPLSPTPSSTDLIDSSISIIRNDSTNSLLNNSDSQFDLDLNLSLNDDANNDNILLDLNQNLFDDNTNELLLSRDLISSNIINSDSLNIDHMDIDSDVTTGIIDSTTRDSNSSNTILSPDLDDIDSLDVDIYPISNKVSSLNLLNTAESLTTLEDSSSFKSNSIKPIKNKYKKSTKSLKSTKLNKSVKLAKANNSMKRQNQTNQAINNHTHHHHHHIHDNNASLKPESKDNKEASSNSKSSPSNNKDATNTNKSSESLLPELFVCKIINPITKIPCSAQFSRPYDLTRHKNTIHAENKIVFHCLECVKTLGDQGYQKTFSRLDALSRHIKSKHESLSLQERKEITNFAKKNLTYITA